MKQIEVPIRLISLIEEIFTSDKTIDEWFALERKVEQYFETATNEELEYFTDSGAGETLSMICSGLRYEMKK